MVDVNDFELAKTSDEPPAERAATETSWLWLVVAAMLVASAAAFYLVASRRNRPAPGPANQVAAASQGPVRPLGGTAAPVNVPPLDQSDPIVRELVKQITSHPKIAAWLATEQLIRTFTVAVDNVSGGVTPARPARGWRPPSCFRTVCPGGGPPGAPPRHDP